MIRRQRDKDGVSHPGQFTPGQSQACDAPGIIPAGLVTVLSLFPGIGLLDMGFEWAGFSVVRGPDLIFGGDIRRFHVASGLFAGVIGGSPCQDFSGLRRDEPTGYGQEMIEEFRRVVCEAMPVWWLLENVQRVPDVRIDGYSWQRLDLRANEFGLKQSRLRHFQFGSRDGLPLVIARGNAIEATEPCCTATEGQKPDRRSWADFCQLQGLPRDFDLPSFKQSAKYRAVGNGVPVPMAFAVASGIKNRLDVTACACGCGRPVTGNKTRATAACRKRIQRRRELADVSELPSVTAAKSQRETVT